MDPLMDAIVRTSLARRQGAIEDAIQRVRTLCQSPIEERLGLCLLATDVAALCFTAVIDHIDIDRGMHGFYLWPQMPVGGYRADFGVKFLTHVGTFQLVVECDGHDFHEKTKEQAAHDKARDRSFLDAGWPTMRFTGSEIHRDAMKCADQVGRHLIEKAKTAIAAERRGLSS